jgi:hypothetical protein
MGTLSHPVYRRMRRTVLLALAASTSGCATLVGTGANESIDLRAAPAAGSTFVFNARNGYNRELLPARAALRFAADGARLDGYPYEEASNAGFGRALAPIVARQFDAEGRLLAWERADGLRTVFDPPLQVLPIPMVPGRALRQDTLARDSDGTPARRVIMVARVGQWETTRVPAGEFRVLRVERDLYLGNAEFFRTETLRQEIDWYSPELGIVVRSSEDSRHQDLAMGNSRRNPFASVRRGDWLTLELAELPGVTVKR